MLNYTKLLRTTAIILCFVLIFSSAGCWNRRELNTLAILVGMGVDKAENTDQVQLTAQIFKPVELKGASESYYLNVQSTGDTVFDALRNFTKQTSRKVYLPHNQVLIFGETAAREGVQNYIDFFVRDHETRLTTDVLVAGSNAGEILEVESELEKTPATAILHLLDAQNATSKALKVSLKDFVSSLLTVTTAPVAPLIEILTEGEEKVLNISGMAVFKNDKLVGYLDHKESRGMLWVRDEIRSGIITIPCSSGKHKSSLEIISTSGKIVPIADQSGVRIQVKINVESHIGDRNDPAELTMHVVKDLEQKEEAEIKEEVSAVLAKARVLNADIFGFGESIYRKYPKQWQELEKHWDEVFPELEVEVIVDAHIRRSGTILKTIKAVKDKEDG